jgi:hypothetical protein
MNEYVYLFPLFDLTFPNLKSFHVETANMSQYFDYHQGNVMAFLRRHPHLESLKLGFRYGTDSYIPPIAPDFLWLPNLISFEGPWKLLPRAQTSGITSLVLSKPYIRNMQTPEDLPWLGGFSNLEYCQLQGWWVSWKLHPYLRTLVSFFHRLVYLDICIQESALKGVIVSRNFSLVCPHAFTSTL